MTGTSVELLVQHGDDRLDVFLASQDIGLTRSRVRTLLDEGHVLLNGMMPKPSQKVQPGDRVVISVPPPRTSFMVPEPLPLNIIYQDEYLLVVDKPAGLTVHPAPGHPSHTLANALLAWCPDLAGIGGVLRPGIVHRLDKDTSGLMVVAKNEKAHSSLTVQLQNRTVHKGYLALVCGKLMPEEGVIEGPIGRNPRHRKRMAVVEGGRPASTRYVVSKGLEGYTFVEVFPKTGRTHQIRVHFAHIGHPLYGDPVYGKKSSLLDRQFLHANTLGFEHPGTNNRVEFTSPLPEDLSNLLQALGHQS